MVQYKVYDVKAINEDKCVSEEGFSVFYSKK